MLTLSAVYDIISEPAKGGEIMDYIYHKNENTYYIIDENGAIIWEGGGDEFDYMWDELQFNEAYAREIDYPYCYFY